MKSTWNIEKHISLIAYYHLITTLLGLAFYLLCIFGIVEQVFALQDHVKLGVNTVAGLLVFWGISRKKGWGWKLTVLATPLSWAYGVYELSTVYQPGIGTITSIFIFVDVMILKILFAEDARAIFGITDGLWPGLSWLRKPLFVVGVFFLTLDMFGNQGAVVAAVVLFAALESSKKYVANQAKLDDEG